MESKEIEKKKIKELLEFLKNHPIDIENREMIKEIEDNLADIMKMELDELDMNIKFDPRNYENEDNDVTLNFFRDNDPKNRYLAGSLNFNSTEGKPKVNINSFYYNTVWLNNEKPEVRVQGAERMIRTLFHELRHYKQFLMIKQGVSNKKSLNYAKDFVLMKIAGFYDENYDSYGIENDANLSAVTRFQEIMGENESLMRAKFLYEGEYETGRYRFNTIDKNGKTHKRKKFRNNVTNTLVDILICSKKKKEVFDIAPILLKEYNEDCTRKTPGQLVSEMKKEQEFLSRLDFISEEEQQGLINDSKEMYYEILLRSLVLSNDDQDKELLEVLDIDQIKNLLDCMNEYFYNEMENKTRHAEKMQVVQSRPGEFPTPYFRHKNPLKKLLKKNDKIYKDYDAKKKFLSEYKETIEELDKKIKQDLLHQKVTNQFRQYLQVKEGKEAGKIQLDKSIINTSNFVLRNKTKDFER